MLLVIVMLTGISVFVALWLSVSYISPDWMVARLKTLRIAGESGGNLRPQWWWPRDLIDLGLQAGLTNEEVGRRLSYRPVHALVGGIAGLMVGALSSVNTIICFVLGFVAGWWWLKLALTREATRRQRQLEHDLPSFIDRFALGAQAGLNIRQAFQLATQRSQGPLSQLARRAVQRMELGATLAESLAPELRGVAPGPVRLMLSSLIQAERVGAPLVQMAGEQANFVRQLNYFRLQQAAEALPLKLTICGIVFLFPPVFVVLLIPTLINFLEAGW